MSPKKIGELLNCVLSLSGWVSDKFEKKKKRSALRENLGVGDALIFSKVRVEALYSWSGERRSIEGVMEYGPLKSVRFGRDGFSIFVLVLGTLE